MFKMLVVDDNPADRRGICTLFDWEKLNIELCGSCSNGEKALRLIEEREVDIVLTDIAMPVMNGIELSERLKIICPRIKVIFMSCYSDFEYARSAMNLDICGYVLKPVIPDELLRSIQKLMDEFREEKSKQNEREAMAKQINDMLPMVQEQFLRECLLGKCFDREETRSRTVYLRLGDGNDAYYCVLALSIDDYEAQISKLTVEEKYWLAFSINRDLSSRSTRELNLFPVQFSGREYAAVLFINPNLSGELPDPVELAVGIHTSLKTRVEISVTVGISPISGDIGELHRLYGQALEAVNMQFYRGGDPIIRYEWVKSGRYATLEQTVNLEKLYHEVKNLVTSGDPNEAEAFVEYYFNADANLLPESYVKSLTFSIVNMIAVIITEWGYSFGDIFGREEALWVKLSRFKTIVNLRQWLLNLFKALREYFTERSASRDLRVVDAIRQVVRERYHEQLSVEEIARSVYLSQSYANSILKRETGKSIFEFLLEYRLEMAKKLLMEPDSKVTAVADRVGYENKSHFSLMFKKYVGLSPSDYKARYASEGRS